MSYWTEVDPPMSFIPEGWSYAQKRDFRYKCIPYLPGWVEFTRYAGKRVLCVGDGSGIDAVEFARAGAHVSAIDMSEKAIALTVQHFAEMGLPRQCAVGDACKLQYDNAMFDAVYSFGVIHHIPEVEKAVSEIARVLKPGGEFLGMVYNKDSLLYAYSIVLRGQQEGLTPDEAMRKYSERNPDCPHSVAYTKDELYSLLFDFGLEAEIDVQYPVIDLPARRKVQFKFENGQEINQGWHLCFQAVKR